MNYYYYYYYYYLFADDIKTFRTVKLQLTLDFQNPE